MSELALRSGLGTELLFESVDWNSWGCCDLLNNHFHRRTFIAHLTVFFLWNARSSLSNLSPIFYNCSPEKSDDPGTLFDNRLIGKFLI